MDICEKAAYLKGLYEGLGIAPTTPEGKLFGEMITMLSEMAEKINDLEVECQELRDYCEELDEDLGAVEEVLCDVFEDEDDEDEDDDDFYEVTCPACGEVVCFDEDCDPADLVCPACGEEFDCTCDGNCEGCEGCGDDADAE